MKNNSRVLYIIDDETSAQFRYRVKNTAEIIDGTKRRVDWVLRTKLSGVELLDYDLVILLRQTDRNGEIGNLINYLHDNGKKVILDLDDLVFNYRDLPKLMLATNSKNLVYWMGYCWGVRRIAKRVDGFICTNDFLANKLKKSFGKPVRVIRNSLNREQVEMSEQLLKEKTSQRNKQGHFTIGYFSGSPTHKKDFGLVEWELIRMIERHEDVNVLVVGYMEFSNRMKELISRGRVKTMGPVEYLGLLKLISRVDINIAPLVMNDFTNCKSELKFFEAAVVETTTIASPTYTFKKAIKNGKNGFLAKKGEWYDKLEYLYEHPEENRKVALAAREYALRHYYGKEFLKEVEGVYDYFAK